MQITSEQLSDIAPHCRYPEDWVRPLNDAMQKTGIAENLKRVCAFIGQIAVESAQFNRVEENLHYSPQRIVVVWPTRFPDLESALPYGRNPEKLANKVYADRMGNGARETGDGFRYRGRGLIQITGRDNYQAMADRMSLPGLMQMPDWLLVPRHAAMSAALFWEDNGLNDIADTITGKNLKARVKAISKRVAGGLSAVDDRVEFTQRAIDTLDQEFAV
jgi:putative chitinase